MKTAFLYADSLPKPTGSGGHLRFFSNARAYLDLGYDLEFVHLSPTADTSGLDHPHLKGLRYVHVPTPPEACPSFAGKLAYRLGRVIPASCRYFFPRFDATLQAVRERTRRVPDAIHQLDGDSVACVMPFVPRGIHKVWGSHDISSQTIAYGAKISQELEQRPPRKEELREIRFFEAVERSISRSSDLTLCISTLDRSIVSSWGNAAVETLPMSIAREEVLFHHPGVLRSGKLSVLHLGSVIHLPNFRSLEFLCTKILPLLEPEYLRRLSIQVAGFYDAEHPRCRRVLNLAGRFPETIQFLGRVPDLDPLYASSDLQLVLSTEATGLRTRIIESFAFGLPVLSSQVAAQGIEGLDHRRNILLGDSPQQILILLRNLIDAPQQLPALAAAAHQDYLLFHSREVVATRLERYLSTYFKRV